MKGARILLIDGDEALRAEIVPSLIEAGFQVTEVADGYQGLSSIYESLPDLVVMAQDLLVPNAEELCLRLRQVSYLPIIVLGSRKKGVDETEMLELGADAYMSKPPAPIELIARVRSLLRRRGRGSNTLGGDSGSELGERTSRRGNGTGDLTATEFRLLSCLMLNEGRLVPYSQLISEVWGGKPVTLDCLKIHVRRLRHKLRLALASPGYILNQRGVGYRFCRTI